VESGMVGSLSHAAEGAEVESVGGENEGAAA